MPGTAPTISRAIAFPRDPGDISTWSPEQTFNNGAGTTYSNLHYLPTDNGGAGRLYNFTRTVGFDPNILVSTNFGDSWSYGGRLLAEGTNSGSAVCALRLRWRRAFTYSPRSGIHETSTTASITAIFRTASCLTHSVASSTPTSLIRRRVAPASLSKIFATGTQFGGTTMRRAWTIDVAIDDAGLPYAVFQAVRTTTTPTIATSTRNSTARNWAVHELAKAGGFLYAAENDYTGLVALDPHDPNRLFISTKIDPRTEVAMAHYEIFEGTTTDGGRELDLVADYIQLHRRQSAANRPRVGR